MARLGRQRLAGLLRGEWRRGGRYEEVGAAGEEGAEGRAVQMADIEGAPLRGGGAPGSGWDEEAQAPVSAGSGVHLHCLPRTLHTQITKAVYIASLVPSQGCCHPLPASDVSVHPHSKPPTCALHAGCAEACLTPLELLSHHPVQPGFKANLEASYTVTAVLGMQGGEEKAKEDEDEDVAAERARVGSTGAATDSLCLLNLRKVYGSGPDAKVGCAASSQRHQEGVCPYIRVQ